MEQIQKLAQLKQPPHIRALPRKYADTLEIRQEAAQPIRRQRRSRADTAAISGARAPEKTVIITRARARARARMSP